MNTTKKPASAQEIRRRELAQIHIAVQSLGMTDDDHRSLLWSVCQVKSAADLDWQGRKRYIGHLKRLGFQVRHKPQPSSKSSRQLDLSPAASKVRALWLFLNEIDVVSDPSEAALAKYVRRITRVDDLHWLNAAQVERLIESLKKWAMRYLPTKIHEAITMAGINHVSPPIMERYLTNPANFDAALDVYTALIKPQPTGGTL